MHVLYSVTAKYNVVQLEFMKEMSCHQKHLKINQQTETKESLINSD